MNDPESGADPSPAVPDVKQASAAKLMASRLPYVRVVVRPHGNAVRAQTEASDVFGRGLMLRSHKGDTTATIERRLEVGNLLYFHAGRTHPDYGGGVFVLEDLHAKHTASPFGLGGLCCPGLGEWHERGQCIDPVAHWPDPDQRTFVLEWLWTENEWREEAAHFLAQYFGEDLAAYFASGIRGKPVSGGPEGIFGTSRNTDWRTWTIEVQAYEDVDLRALARDGRVRYWGITPEVSAYLRYDTTEGADGRPLTEAYPLLAELPRRSRLRAPMTAAHTVLDDADELIQLEVMDGLERT